MIFRNKASIQERLNQQILDKIKQLPFSEIIKATNFNEGSSSRIGSHCVISNFEAMGIHPILNFHDNERLFIELVLGFPIHGLNEKSHGEQPFKAQRFENLTKLIQPLIPSYKIEWEITSFIKPHRTQLISKGLRGVKNTIAIASGKGGVGKSTVTVNLAAALAREGARVGILDADIYGPSIPLMLGEAKPEKQADGSLLPAFAHGIYAMSIAYLIEQDQALIWRGPMLAKSLIQLLNITVWDDLDYLLIDLPPGTGDIQLSLVQKIPLAGAVVVTTPQTIATADAQKAIKMFKKTNIELLGLIENMAMYHCPQCGHEDDIFGTLGGERLSESNNVPFLGRLPLNKQIQYDCDDGNPTALRINNELANIWRSIAFQTTIELATKPLNYANKFPDIVVE